MTYTAYGDVLECVERARERGVRAAAIVTSSFDGGFQVRVSYLHDGGVINASSDGWFTTLTATSVSGVVVPMSSGDLVGVVGEDAVPAFLKNSNKSVSLTEGKLS